MAHDLAVELTRCCSIEELINAVQGVWPLLFGDSVQPAMRLNQIQRGVVGAPLPATIGHGDALYCIALGGIELNRLGTYIEVNEEWEEFSGPAWRAIVAVPYGSPPIAHLFAVLVALGLANLNGGRISDIGSHWLGRSGCPHPADEFLKLFLATEQSKKWRAETLAER